MANTALFPQLTPTQFLESINSINEVLISAHSLRHAFLDNVITLMSLQLSRLVMSTHFQKVRWGWAFRASFQFYGNQEVAGIGE